MSSPNGRLNAEIGEDLHVGDVLGGGSDLAGGHVALQAHVVNGRTVGLDHADQVLRAGGFGARLVTVVVGRPGRRCRRRRGRWG